MGAGWGGRGRGVNRMGGLKCEIRFKLPAPN